MKPTDLNSIVENLRALGFEVLIEPGQVDRGNRPMSVKLDVKSRDLSIEEREAFSQFFDE
jgi:hypothetical protein